MRRVDAQDPREPGQRTGQVELVTGPGNMAVAEVLQVVVNAGGHRHAGAARGHHLAVLGGPELTHVQAIDGEAPVDRHQELGGPGAQQALQQLRHRSALCFVAGFRFDVVQSWKLSTCRSKNAKRYEQNNTGDVPG